MDEDVAVDPLAEVDDLADEVARSTVEFVRVAVSSVEDNTYVAIAPLIAGQTSAKVS